MYYFKVTVSLILGGLVLNGGLRSRSLATVYRVGSMADIPLPGASGSGSAGAAGAVASVRLTKNLNRCQSDGLLFEHLESGLFQGRIIIYLFFI